MINVLYISLNVPVSNSPHAGGQLAHYYVKKLNENPDINLRIISYCSEKDESLKLQLDKDGFNGECFNIPKRNVVKKFLNKFNTTTYGFIAEDMVYQVKMRAKSLFYEGFIPDRIIFDWEDISFTLPVVKKIFPNAKYSVIEQDVRLQSIYRYYKQSNTFASRIYYSTLYKRLIKADKKYFPQFDEVVVFSQKDKLLIEDNNIKTNKIRVISPFYYDYSDLKIAEPKENIIIFFGYLKRSENIEAVTWFINEVLPKVQNIKFIVIGGGVPDSVKALESEKVNVTGFLPIDKLRQYFESALCMVSPLFHGAGVKIKVFEGMSAGLPVLTNDIGIEGIDAINGESFFYCKTADDYAATIEKLVDNKSLRVTVGQKAREHIHNKFNYKDSSYIDFKSVE